MSSTRQTPRWSTGFASAPRRFSNVEEQEDEYTLPVQDSRIPHADDGEPPPRMSSIAQLQVSPSKQRAYAASAHPLDGAHQPKRPSTASRVPSSTAHRMMGADHSFEPALNFGRRTSLQVKQNGLSYSPNNHYHSSPLAGRSAPGHEQDSESPTLRMEGTESTVSTTAPSTVWDELDDLKSRIRNIELTGKLPKSSNAAISSAIGDRPNTANTTVTTVSSSPKRIRADDLAPMASSSLGPQIANVHPLLHSALSRSKSLINAAVYKQLETTVIEALELAVTTGDFRDQGKKSSSVLTDRQLKRKIDSMCRSLTELCISLSDQSTAEVARARSDSRSTEHIQPRESSVDRPRPTRHNSHEPIARTSSRALTRLEARRSNIGLNGSRYSSTSPRGYQEISTPTQTTLPSAASLQQVSSSSRRIRLRESPPEERETPTIARPPSRAMTELGTQARGQYSSSRQYLSTREYTSRHPLPSPRSSTDQRSPPLQFSSQTQHGGYFPSTVSQIPSTPSNNIPSENNGGVSRRNVDRSTPTSADSARLAEARQARIASLGLYKQHLSTRASTAGSAVGIDGSVNRY